MNHYPQSLPLQQVHQQQQPVELLKPPKWIKKPCGVSFGVSTCLSCLKLQIYVIEIIFDFFTVWW